MPEGMNSIPRGRRLIVAILLLAAAMTVAAIVASVSPWLSQRPWHLRFALQALAVVAAAAPVWLWKDHSRTAPFAAKNACGRRSGPLAEFLVVADHEMKTPLAGIKAYVELLADGDADDESTRDEFLQGICSQADRLERAIDELLERARLEIRVVQAESSVANVS